jgi:hypothetical protein
MDNALRTFDYAKFSFAAAIGPVFHNLISVVRQLMDDVVEIEHIPSPLWVGEEFTRTGSANTTPSEVALHEVLDASINQDACRSKVAAQRKLLPVLLAHIDDLLAGGRVGAHFRAEGAAAIAMEVFRSIHL